MLKIGIISFCIIMIVRKFAIENIQNDNAYSKALEKCKETYKKTGRLIKYKIQNRKNKARLSTREWLEQEKAK